MANRCHVVFGKIKGRSQTDSHAVLVMHRDIFKSETLQVGNQVKTTTGVAPAMSPLHNTFVDITTERTCWLAIGPNPNPQADPRWLVLENTTITITVEPGDKVAVVAA